MQAHTKPTEASKNQQNKKSNTIIVSCKNWPPTQTIETRDKRKNKYYFIVTNSDWTNGRYRLQSSQYAHFVSETLKSSAPHVIKPYAVDAKSKTVLSSLLEMHVEKELPSRFGSAGVTRAFVYVCMCTATTSPFRHFWFRAGAERATPIRRANYRQQHTYIHTP